MCEATDVKIDVIEFGKCKQPVPPRGTDLPQRYFSSRVGLKICGPQAEMV